MKVGRLNPWAAGRPIPAPKRGAQTRLSLAPASRDASLHFTDWLLIGVMCLAYFISISVPLFGYQFHQSFLKHVPLLLLMPIMALHLLGLGMNRTGLRWGPIGSIIWPLIALALYALTGSAVAKWAFEIEDSYLTFGAYLLLLPLFAASVPGGAARARSFAIVLIGVWVLFSAAAFIGESVRFGSAGLLHEIEYLVTAGFFVLYYAFRSRFMKALALILLIAAAVVNQKLTGYLVSAFAVIYIVVGSGWRSLMPQWRGAYIVVATLTTVAVVSALVTLYFVFREHLPSGNVDVRTHQYQAAWRDFLASPVWGHAFLTGSGEDFKSGFSMLYIPTHSDVLDILKHGGLIGLVLFSWGYIAIFLALNRAIAVTRDDMLLNAFFLGARFFQLTALITFSFNPILLKGPFLVVIWGNLGLALGLALHVLAQHRAAGQGPGGSLPEPASRLDPASRGTSIAGTPP